MRGWTGAAPFADDCSTPVKHAWLQVQTLTNGVLDRKDLCRGSIPVESCCTRLGPQVDPLRRAFIAAGARRLHESFDRHQTSDIGATGTGSELARRLLGVGWRARCRKAALGSARWASAMSSVDLVPVSDTEYAYHFNGLAWMYFRTLLKAQGDPSLIDPA